MTSEQLDPTLPYLAKINNVSLNIYLKSVTENDIKKKMNTYIHGQKCHPTIQ